LSILSLLLAACGLIATPEPTATSTPAPTETATPAPTATRTPAPSLSPTEKPDPASLLMPHGEPESEWEGIPIMPEAIAGEGDATSYRFLVEGLTREDVLAYYNARLPALGWNPLGIGTGDGGAPALVIYTGAEGTLTLSLIDAGEGQLIVMFVK
jgi:hypothetical protein